MAETNGQATTNGAHEGPAKDRDPWRDAAGRYLPGNPGGPGNPYVRELANWRAEIRRLTPRGVFEMAVARLQSKAMTGHYPSLRLFLQYVAGQPDRSVDIDRLDIHELELAVARLKAERAAREAGVPLVEAPPTGIPQLPPKEPLPPIPPPQGRPESEWRRTEREPRRATPPPGATVVMAGLIAKLVKELDAVGATDSLERVSAWLDSQANGGQSAQDETAAVYKRDQTAGGEEGPPECEAAPEPR